MLIKILAFFQVELLYITDSRRPGAVSQGGWDDYSFHPVPGSLRMITVSTLLKVTILYGTIHFVVQYPSYFCYVGIFPLNVY